MDHTINSNNTKWKKYLRYQTNTDKILFHGSQNMSALLRFIRNSFWKDTFNTYQTLNNKIEIEREREREREREIL